MAEVVAPFSDPARSRAWQRLAELRRRTTLAKAVRFCVGSLAMGLGLSALTCAQAPSTARSSRPLEASPGDYEVTTCRGVNQTGLRCASGIERRFDGALVCKLDGEPWEEQPGQALCAQLPHGCREAPPGLGFASLTHARCSAEDPDCGPLLADGAGCVEEAGFVWDAPRLPVGFPGGGHCEHDGDCVASSPCVACTSRHGGDRLTRGCSTPRGAAWRRTFCGCVRGQCGLFRQ